MTGLNNQSLSLAPGFSCWRLYSGMWETDAQFAGMAAGVDGRAIPQSLVALTDQVEVLARLVDVGGGDYGPTFTLHCNRLGGRIAVATFSPWTLLGRAWKQRQRLAVADYISTSTLPVVMETHAHILQP